ncbi:DUF1799 domain-containing protein [Halomonas sabkhae]|uniref:DUF1799 domain-containing protein n=1 Tax=Halomonas sabkhae TaxID=626223 RepID=UPI0025B4328F|nr:DUF1799 domain-containing protein [Halomonas sabkhae]MDN3525634.1 DUF1799 domain-containing protein [Halomonas sabkhae]
MEDARAADAEAFGIAPPEDPADETRCEVWAEHWSALELFMGLSTQWRVVAGMNGVFMYGLDYQALYGHPRYSRLDYDAQDEMLEQIQQIEAGALEVLNS